MRAVHSRSCSRIGLVFLSWFVVLSSLHAQAPTHYEATLESLNQHPLPQWYAEAKLGIFIHWGLYSVPGWAPLVHPEHDFASPDYIHHNPYAEWYLNSMRLEGSPTQAYHREQYGADYDYWIQRSTTYPFGMRSPNELTGPWVYHLVDAVKNTERNLPKKHLLARESKVFLADPWISPLIPG